VIVIGDRTTGQNSHRRTLLHPSCRNLLAQLLCSHRTIGRDVQTQKVAPFVLSIVELLIAPVQSSHLFLRLEVDGTERTVKNSNPSWTSGTGTPLIKPMNNLNLGVGEAYLSLMYTVLIQCTYSSTVYRIQCLLLFSRPLRSFIISRSKHISLCLSLFLSLSLVLKEQT
jgi:hypothetical protein